MRTVTAAVVGAVCGAGWNFSFPLASDLPCDGAPMACTAYVLLLAVPALVVFWAVVAWGLLRLARFRPAWPTVFAGTMCAVVMAYVLALVTAYLESRAFLAVVPVSGAIGYALASAATAGYRGRRDRAEHSGQDG
ncbi:hypothetical protein AB0M48_12885 [Lentzea sp. NPDC051208]|uniref:hypothetical protein n=1 Tax=Lentzea sp. NPDC051208 TaxID=3154642 RepID=UPI003441803C